MADYTLSAKLTADASQLKSEFTNVQNSLKSMNSNMQSAGASMTSTGAKLTAGVSAPIAAAGATFIKTGATFEQTMSKVEAISGASAKDMEKYEKQARDLGKATKYSATEAAEGQAFLAMAGFKTTEVLDAMPAVLDLAAAGQMDLGHAADVSSNIMSGFGMEAKEMGHVTDVLAYASANANTDVSQLGEAMKYLAPSANSLGWGIEESAAAVMAFSDAGIQGSMAGQAFASSLGRLSKPTKEMRNVMNDLGIEFFDAQGNMKPMPELVANLEKATKGMTAEQKAATLTTLFGSEAYKHWAVLLEKGSTELEKNTTNLKNADGAAREMAKTMSDNLLGRVDAMKAAFEDVGITVFNVLAPALEAVVKAITNVLQWFGELPPAVVTTVVVFGALAAALPVILMGAGMMVSAIGALGAAFAGIGSFIGPAIAALAAFGVAVGSAFALSDVKFDFSKLPEQISAALEPIKVRVQEIFSGLFGGGEGSGPDFSGLIESIKSKIAPIKEAIAGLFGGGDGEGIDFSAFIGKIAEVASTLMQLSPVVQIVKGVFDGFGETIIGNLAPAFASVFPVVLDFFSTLGNVAMSLLPAVSGVIGIVVEVIGTLAVILSEIVATILPVFAGLLQQLLPLFERVAEIVGEALNQIMPLLEHLMSALLPVLADIITTVVTLLADVVSAVAPALVAILGVIIELIGALLPVLISIIGIVAEIAVTVIAVVAPILTAVAGLISALFQIIAPIVTFIAGIIAAIIAIIAPIIDMVATIFLTMVQVAGAIFRTIIGVIQVVVTAIVGVIRVLVGAVTTVFNAIFGIVKGVMTKVGSVVKSIFDGIKNAWTGLTDFVQGIFDGISAGLKNLVDKTKSMVNGMIGGLNAAVSIINKIPGVNISPIPQLYRGTDNFGGGLARMNEGGRGEMVLLPSGAQVIPHDVSMAYAREAGRSNAAEASRGGGGYFENRTINLAGLFEGASISVRNDQDITQLSRALYGQIERAERYK